MLKASLYHLANKILRRFVPLMTGMLFSASLPAQDFNYSFTKDSVAWQELNTQTILNTNNSAWNFYYKIPIGFSFEYLGKSFDSLKIEKNGFLVFDADRNYAITSFSSFSDRIDSTGAHSILGYDLSGNEGNRILKIQFKSLGEAGDGYLTYQVWIRENGDKVEFHIGPNCMQLSPYDPVCLFDENHYSRIGFVNMNMNTQVCGFFAAGNPSAPESQLVQLQNLAPVYLDGMPHRGIVYVFTPSSN